MNRMMDDYFDKFYYKLATRFESLAKNNYAEAKAIADWKKEVAAHWDSFRIVLFDYDAKVFQPVVDEDFTIEIVIDRMELKSMLGIDIVYTRENPENHEMEYIHSESFKLKKEEGSMLYFELKRTAVELGRIKVGFRIYPYNEKLPHRMDFAYVRWIQS
jgi:starch phosphorylase